MLRFSILLLAGTAFAQQYTISTVAGGAPPATPASALNTSIGQPRKLAVSGGNLYFSSGHSVFKIDASGSMTLVAGNSRAGFSGDGGPAVNAQLNTPQGIAVDSGGQRLHRRFAEQPRPQSGHQRHHHHLRRQRQYRPIPVSGAIPGPPPTPASSCRSAWRWIPPATVYIAASADNTIRKVTTDGIINIFAGAGYKGYYGDYHKDSISGTVTSVGTATIAGLTGPQDVAIGPKGSILIADTGNGAIRQVDSAGIITTISGNGSIGTQRRRCGHHPRDGLPLRRGGGFQRQRIRRRVRHQPHPQVDATGKITTAIGDGIQGFAGDGGPANKVEMSLPTGVAVDSSGNVYFADSLNNRIRKLAGGNVNTFAGNGLLSRSGDGGAGHQRAAQYAARRRRDPTPRATSTSPTPRTTRCAACPTA